MIRLSCVTQNKRKCPYARAEEEGMGGGERKKSPTSLTTLLQECGSLHRLSKKYLLPLEKQSTTPIVHYTFHYIEFNSCFRCGIQRSKTCQSLPLLKRTRFERYNKIQPLQRLMSCLHVSFIRPFLTFIIVATE